MDVALEVVEEIKNLAKVNGVQKVILFGSRARGDNFPRSDIDLAVKGGDVQTFRFDVDEKTQTLLMFDVVDLNRNISKELENEIKRDGITLYEKV